MATCRVLGGLRQLVRSSRVGAGAAVGEWEVGGEPRQVRGRRATPAVDGLDRVADRGQRQPVVDPATEQRRQRDPLRMPGVLVLVEQHHPVAVPQRAARPAGTATASRAAAAICMPKSIAFSARSLACRASISGTSSVRSVCVASIRSSHWLGPRSRWYGAGGQGVHEPLQLEVGVAQLVGGDEVFGELTRTTATPST